MTCPYCGGGTTVIGALSVSALRTKVFYLCESWCRSGDGKLYRETWGGPLVAVAPGMAVPAETLPPDHPVRCGSTVAA